MTHCLWTCFFFLNFVRNNTEKIETSCLVLSCAEILLVMTLRWRLSINTVLLVTTFNSPRNYSRHKLFYVFLHPLRQSRYGCSGKPLKTWKNQGTHGWKQRAFFSFWISFLGWFILSILSCGIGFLFFPYPTIG